jgi:hypothetical protein
MPAPEVTYAQFVARYPEFQPANNVPAAFVEVVLAEAINQISFKVFGERYTEAVLLETAYKLSLSPFGQGNNIPNPNNRYERARKQLRLETVPRGLVTGCVKL